MTGIKEVVSQLKGVIDEHLGKRGAGDASVPASDGGRAGEVSGSVPAVGSGVPFSGTITSRNDVLQVLDQICEYYERYEPSSPVPIFMKRAKQLVPMGFAELIQNLAPEAMPKIDIYTGTAAAPPA